ncbi:MAG: hypothetical protein ACPHRI_00880 [Flavobacteriaceae bacterium]
MKYHLLFLLICINLYAQSPLIDGVVDSLEWAGASRFSIGYEIEPADNTAAPYNTDVFITTTPTDILVGFIAEADMSNLRSSVRSRDQINDDENVAIGIDIYGDGRSMIVLGSNPEGSQFDIKILPDGSNDDYNMAFETFASKHKDSYHVEFRIPIRNFSFSSDDIQRWKLVFGRNSYVGTIRTQFLSFPYDRTNPCVVCQSTDELVLRNISIKKRASLLPYVYAGQSGERNDNNDFIQNPIKGDIRLSGLFDLNRNTFVEFAINPDFSQIEADVSQIDVNETFALFYPERRPYFNEGNDIIVSEQNAVYTRSIYNPIASSKLIRQGKNQRIYWLSAYDQNAPYLVAGQNKSYSGEGKEAWSNILGYQQVFEQGQRIGLLSTNRFFKDGGHGQLFGINGLIGLTKTIDLNFEYNFSTLEEPISSWIDSSAVEGGKTVALDGETKNGSGLSVILTRNTNNWTSNLSYDYLTPNYEAPLGFITQNDLQTLNFNQRYTYFPKDKSSLIQNLNAEANGSLDYTIDGLPRFAGLYFVSRIVWRKNFRTGTEFYHTIKEVFEGFTGRSITGFGMWNNYNPNKAISIGAFFSVGEEFWYDEDNPAVGNHLYTGTFTTIQPNSKLRIRTTIRYGQLKSKVDQSIYFSGALTRTTVNYQFNNNLSFRLVGEHNSFDDKFFIQPLLKWNPNPFTVFYAGGSHGYRRPEVNPSVEKDFELENSQLYLKFQYLFDI